MITIIAPEWLIWTGIGLMAIHICLLVTTIHYQKKAARARKWGGEVDVTELFEEIGK